VLQATDATHLIMLRDFLHALRGVNPATLAALQQWRCEWPGTAHTFGTFTGIHAARPQGNMKRSLLMVRTKL